jgi:hypothetical protein
MGSLAIDLSSWFPVDEQGLEKQGMVTFSFYNVKILWGILNGPARPLTSNFGLSKMYPTFFIVDKCVVDCYDDYERVHNTTRGKAQI